MRDVTLVDIENGTIFQLQFGGPELEKSNRGTGNQTICYPKFGGKFQRSKKFEQPLDNTTKVILKP